MKYQSNYLIILLLLAYSILTAQKSDTIRINTNFEGGNLGSIEKLKEGHYRFHLNGESDWQDRNRQVSWYYFQMEGGKDQELTIELTDLVGEYNFQPGTHAITKHTRPVFSYDRKHWNHLSDQQVIWHEDSKELILKFKPEQNTIWIAHQPPYTNQDLNNVLARYQNDRSLIVDTIGMTPGGRPMLLLSIGKNQSDSHAQKVIWLMARQHSWESGTSWVMESVLHFLLDSTAGIHLRDSFIFKIFPMADPDGVARGGVRFNRFGHDLNRNWDLVKKGEMPEIYQQKEAVKTWLSEGNLIDFFLTLHNTESSDYLQGPALQVGEKTWQKISEQSSFQAPEGLRSIRPNVDEGRMTVYENLWFEFKIPAYLMELKVEKVDKLGRHRNIEDWSRLGPALVRSITFALR